LKSLNFNEKALNIKAFGLYFKAGVVLEKSNEKELSKKGINKKDLIKKSLEQDLSKKGLSIIIVNYNSSEFIINCVASIIKHISFFIPFEIIIVDNASKDNSVIKINEYIDNLKNITDGKDSFNNIIGNIISNNFSSNFSNNISIKTEIFKIIKLRQNSGFAKAANIGANKAKYKYLLFLNPDTEFIGEGIKDLIDFYEEKSFKTKIGAVGVKILNPDGTLQYNARSFLTLTLQFYESFFLDKIFPKVKFLNAHFLRWWDHLTVKEVDWLSGAFLFLEKEVFFSVGAFDTEYFIYSEDEDLCLKLVKAGYKNYYYPNFCIIHHDAGIASKNQPLRDFQIWESRRIYFYRNYSKIHAKIFSFLYFFFIFNRAVLFFLMSFFYLRNNYYKKRSKQYFETLNLYLFKSFKGK